MRWRASIAFALLLALSHLVFANTSSVSAQAGSIGGTVGKQDKSISGDEEADRPRAAPHLKRPASRAPEASSGHSCRKIVGTWSWYLGVSDSAFYNDGTARHSTSGATGKWTCAGGTVNVVWSYEGTVRTDRITLSQDGNSIFVVSPWGGGIKFTGKRRGGD
jgi:hypothetical protein